MLPALSGMLPDSAQHISAIAWCGACDAEWSRQQHAGGNGQNARAPQEDTFPPDAILHHEKNAKATSVAMIDAIAVANAEVHADFR